MTQSHDLTAPPRTAAQRQADRRQRLRDAGDQQRLSLCLDLSTYLALKRLAWRDAVTQRQVLTTLIRRADQAVIDTLDDDKPEWDEYFYQRRRRPPTPKETPSCPD